MTVPQSTTPAAFLSRDWLHFARYYLDHRWVLLMLGGGVLVIGAALNWSWLVAAGVAPILLRGLSFAGAESEHDGAEPCGAVEPQGRRAGELRALFAGAQVIRDCLAGQYARRVAQGPAALYPW